MDAGTLILLGCGVVMGAVNNLAGAAGAVGLIGLEMAAGLDVLSANASLRLAGVALAASGWLGYALAGHRVPAQAWRLAALTVPGAAVGALLATTVPVWLYRALLLVVLAGVLVQQLRNRDPSAPARGLQGGWQPLAFVLIGLHMGLLQIGAGLLAILVLTSVHSRDLVEVNVAKMAVALLSTVTATVVLGAAGQIVWTPAVVLAAGAAAGSFLASRWSVRKGHGAVRVVVLGITIAVLVRLVWQTAID